MLNQRFPFSALAFSSAPRSPSSTPAPPQPPQQEDSATAKSPVAKPTTEQLKQQIDAELQNKQIQRAFWVALNEGNYELVKWTCSKLSPNQVVGKGKREHVGTVLGTVLGTVFSIVFCVFGDSGIYLCSNDDFLFLLFFVSGSIGVAVIDAAIGHQHQ